MSNIALVSPATGTATFSITTPSGTSTDRTLTLPDNSGTVLTSASDLAAANLSGRVPAANAPLGSVLQVVQGVKTDTASFADNAWRDTLVSVSITPSSASNKILIFFSGQFSSKLDAYNIYTRITRNGTAVGVADAAGSRPQATSVGTRTSDGNTYQSSYGVLLDSPNSTSALTYKIEVQAQENAGTFYINRTNNDNDNNSAPRAASFITVMEIAA
jgi:hypothetical protein